MGHDYFKMQEAKFSGGPIGNAKLVFFPRQGLISRLTLAPNQENPLVKQRRFQVATSDQAPVPELASSRSDYVAVFIPPQTASIHLAQLQGGEPEPAFLLVPREAFYRGVCREGTKPILLGSTESLDQQSLPQIMIGRSALRNMAAALYLDPRSSSPDDLATHYQKFVSEQNWGGWIDLEIKRSKRGLLRRFWNWVSGSTLGAPGVLSGTSVSMSRPVRPFSAKGLVGEISSIETAWNDRLSRFAEEMQALDDQLTRLHTLLDQPSADQQQFLTLAADIVAGLETQGSRVQDFGQKMRREQGLFLSAIEVDYLEGRLRTRLLSLHEDYNKVAAHYARAVRIRPGQIIDPDLVLNPISASLNGTPIKPVRRPAISLPLAKFGGAFDVQGVAYLEPVKMPSGAELYKVKLTALANLSRNMAALKGQAAAQVRAQQTCELRIRFVNLDIPDSTEGGVYRKPVDVGLTVRACATVDVPYPCPTWRNPLRWCKSRKHIKTNLYDTTAHGGLQVRIERLGDDFNLSYGYRICAHGLICSSDGASSGYVLQELKKDPRVAGFLTQTGVTVEGVNLTKARNGDGYLTLQVESGPVTGDQAIIMLNALKQQEI